MAHSLLDYRDRFPILAETTYLNNNSLGAMPAAVADRMADYASIWAKRGVRAWADQWWEMPVRVGDLVAPLIGARPGTVSMHTNVTLATAVFFSCLEPTAAKNKVVTTELQFPSIQYFLQQWCDENGVRLAVVPSDDGITIDQGRLFDEIDASTLAVSISHVLFRSAFIQDAPAVARRCREKGALLLLDAYQSTGVVPTDVTAWGVDALVGGCLKWLCGGPGNVFLYVDPEIAPRLEPRLTGWWAHPQPFAFERPPMRWRDDAFRFLNGTPQVPCLYAAAPGLEIHNEIGVPAIRERSKRMTALVCEEARARGYEVHAPEEPEARGGTIAVDLPHAELVAKELLARDVIIDYRPGAGIRISPHFYNTEDEVRFALAQIEEIVRDRAYEKHQSVAGATPT